MDSKFESAVDFVLQNEGGFANSVNDAGGATNFGISLRFLREVKPENLRKYGFFKAPEALSVCDIENMTREQAIRIYEGEFWSEAPFEKISDMDICDYVFDMCVLHGTSQAIKLLQRALWAVGWNIHAYNVVDDGVLGQHTLAAIDAVDCHQLKTALCAERAGFVRLLVAINPKDREFFNDWITRCYRI